MQPRFSICIPNYNYARYISETIESVISQCDADFEINVSDNSSTDDSIRVIEGFRLRYPNVQLRTSRRNIGFPANVARAAEMASGDYMILLSSDDTCAPGALAAYTELYTALEDRATTSVVASTVNVIDAEGKVLGSRGLDWKLWQGATLDGLKSDRLGVKVYRTDPESLLRRSLQLLRSPFAFASTCYSRQLYQQVEGYHHGAAFNPDKRFAWDLITEASDVYFIDHPCFNYRVHAGNQAAIQAGTGALRHLVDEYNATLSVSEDTLRRAGMSREDLCVAFIEQDIGLRGLREVAAGNRHLARRMLRFGLACYPTIAARNKIISLLRTSLAVGPLGTMIASRVKGAAERRWNIKEAGGQ
ncbi:glycosyltransferase family 2 protein [Mesorhizobium sp.]|uniref:glycosyltransferase family 2 protein n=1 Tax=Mesorhizobium sp. TaxID=1871066 RepID=UPI000FE84FB0|nr:glycosyltransferase family 2 protein [Mesorhizobium sp.]RWO52430.1 MAG: glycosyltransferase family 2 protein [Mesorhizobium sp.]